MLVIRKADDAYCGFCDLQSFAEQSAPELGIALIKDYQHQGHRLSHAFHADGTLYAGHRLPHFHKPC